MQRNDYERQSISRYCKYEYYGQLCYDDAVIRQILQCVIVESKEKIKVVFIGGMEVETEVEQ